MVDTNEMPVVLVPCKYISPEFIKRLDEDYGKHLKNPESEGHVTYTIRFEGRAKPRWWEQLVRLIFDR